MPAGAGAVLVLVLVVMPAPDESSPLSTGTGKYHSPDSLAARRDCAHQRHMASTSVLDRPVAETAAQGRALPANLEAEAAFLGATLIDNRLIEELTIGLRPEHFFEPLHQASSSGLGWSKQISLRRYVESTRKRPAVSSLAAPLSRAALPRAGPACPGGWHSSLRLACPRVVSVGRETGRTALDPRRSRPLRQIGSRSCLSGSPKGRGGPSEVSRRHQPPASRDRTRSFGGTFRQDHRFTSIYDKCGGLHNSDLSIVAGPQAGKSARATISRSTEQIGCCRTRTDRQDGRRGGHVPLEIRANSWKSYYRGATVIPSEALRWAISRTISRS